MATLKKRKLPTWKWIFNREHALAEKNVAGATAVLYDRKPRLIELKAKSTWSFACPYFRFVRLGPGGEFDTKSSAVMVQEGGSKRPIAIPDVALQSWTIPSSSASTP